MKILGRLFGFCWRLNDAAVRFPCYDGGGEIQQIRVVGDVHARQVEGAQVFHDLRFFGAVHVRRAFIQKQYLGIFA